MLALVMFVSIFPLGVFAEGENDNIYSITNGYLTYSFNADTGGFAIETEEGNPKKNLDNNIPKLSKWQIMREQCFLLLQNYEK